MLVCSRYFLGCPRPYLTRAKKANNTEGDLAVSAFIRDISTRDVFVWDTSARDASVWSVSARAASAEGTCIDAKLCGTSC